MHPDDYYDAASYGEDLIGDPFALPFIKLLDMASALRKNPFRFYDPRDIDTRRQALDRAQSTTTADPTLGTGVTNDIIDVSGDDESIHGEEGEHLEDTDDSQDGSDDEIILISKKRFKLTGSESEEDKLEDMDFDELKEDENFDIDELEEDKNQKSDGRSLLKIDVEKLDEDENEKGEGKSLLEEDGDIDELDDDGDIDELDEDEDIDELDEDEDIDELDEDEDIDELDEDEDIDELDEDEDIDELDEDKLDDEKGKGRTLTVHEDENVDELDKDENERGSWTIDQPKEDENEAGNGKSLQGEDKNQDANRERISAGAATREIHYMSIYLSFLIFLPQGPADDSEATTTTGLLAEDHPTQLNSAGAPPEEDPPTAQPKPTTVPHPRRSGRRVAGLNTSAGGSPLKQTSASGLLTRATWRTLKETVPVPQHSTRSNLKLGVVTSGGKRKATDEFDNNTPPKRQKSGRTARK
jgi:hypothetical protein